MNYYEQFKNYNMSKELANQGGVGLYNHEAYKAFKEDLKSKIPIRKGCKNEVCFCTGDCNKIIGYHDPLTQEIEYLKEDKPESQEDWLS